MDKTVNRVLNVTVTMPERYADRQVAAIMRAIYDAPMVAGGVVTVTDATIKKARGGKNAKS